MNSTSCNFSLRPELQIFLSSVKKLVFNEKDIIMVSEAALSFHLKFTALVNLKQNSFFFKEKVISFNAYEVWDAETSDNFLMIVCKVSELIIAWLLCVIFSRHCC